MLDWYLSVCFYMTAAMEVLPSTLLFVLPTSLFLYMKGSVDVGTLISCVLLAYASYNRAFSSTQSPEPPIRFCSSSDRKSTV